jgi:hypothetical protein
MVFSAVLGIRIRRIRMYSLGSGSISQRYGSHEDVERTEIKMLAK